MKKQLCILGLLAFVGLQAQTGKVGINTETPTEIFDVNGTARVRELPTEGETIYTLGTNTTSETKATSFTPKYNIVADENGVLGKEEVSNTGSSTAVTPIFMKRKYSTTDWPTGKNNKSGADTGVSSTEYDAILSLTKLYRNGTADSNSALMYKDGHGMELDLDGSTGTWRVIGDVGSINENWEFTILFIKREYMIESSETRTEI